MATIQHSLRVPAEMEEQIGRELSRRGVSEWSAGVLQLVDEAIQMSRCPGIVFLSGAAGRRAVVAGTGIDVWEVIASWRALDEDYEALRNSYERLTEPQLRAALNYHALYPEEIEERLTREEAWTPERVRAEMPFTRPPALG